MMLSCSGKCHGCPAQPLLFRNLTKLMLTTTVLGILTWGVYIITIFLLIHLLVGV
jgi:hypothetical protein